MVSLLLPCAGRGRPRKHQPHHFMENEDTTLTEASVVPTEDSRNRLTAAREFACEQYDKLRRATASQMESVRAYTQKARHQLNEGWETTCSKARELHKAGEEFVRANPTATTLGALGLGIIIGLVLGGRRH